MTVIHVEAQCKSDCVELYVSIDGKYGTTVFVNDSAKAHMLDDAELGVLEALLAIVTAQGVNARRATISHGVPEGAVEQLQCLCDTIVGSSYLTQGKEFKRCQLIAEVVARDQFPEFESTAERKVLLSWSGGKDALTSSYLLRAAGLTTTAIHFSANTDVSDKEACAAKLLAESKKISLDFVPIEWQGLIEIIGKFREDFGVFPKFNSIPHGRDIFLAGLACISASQNGIKKLALGYERDLLEKSIESFGRTEWRHDAQSLSALSALNHIARATWGVEVFSPLAQFSEFQVFSYLSLNHPTDWSRLQSCFWGDWCGRCSKCRRYALLASFFGRPELLPFETYPLCPEEPEFVNFVSQLAVDKTQPFFETQVMCVDWLLSRPDYRTSEMARNWVQNREEHNVSALSILKEISKIRPSSAANGLGLDFAGYI